jgi:hypothetical protein
MKPSSRIIHAGFGAVQQVAGDGLDGAAEVECLRRAPPHVAQRGEQRERRQRDRQVSRQTAQREREHRDDREEGEHAPGISGDIPAAAHISAPAISSSGAIQRCRPTPLARASSQPPQRVHGSRSNNASMRAATARSATVDRHDGRIEPCERIARGPLVGCTRRARRRHNHSRRLSGTQHAPVAREPQERGARPAAHRVGPAGRGGAQEEQPHEPVEQRALGRQGRGHARTSRPRAASRRASAAARPSSRRFPAPAARSWRSRAARRPSSRRRSGRATPANAARRRSPAAALRGCGRIDVDALFEHR